MIYILSKKSISDSLSFGSFPGYENATRHSGPVTSAKGKPCRLLVIVTHSPNICLVESCVFGLQTGETALMWAAGHGHTDTCRCLIDRGAKLNLVDCVSEIQGLESREPGS